MDRYVDDESGMGTFEFRSHRLVIEEKDEPITGSSVQFDKGELNDNLTDNWEEIVAP